jgi:hypothetical protein
VVASLLRSTTRNSSRDTGEDTSAIAGTVEELLEVSLVLILPSRLRKWKSRAKKTSKSIWIKTQRVEYPWHDASASIVGRESYICTLSTQAYSNHSPIQSVSSIMGGKVVLKLGVFEKVPEPEWEAFAVRRQVWEKPLEGCIQYKLLGGPGKELL